MQIVVEAWGKEPQLGHPDRPVPVLPAHWIPLSSQHRDRETWLELLRYEITEGHGVRRHSRQQNLAVVVEQLRIRREPSTRGVGQPVTGADDVFSSSSGAHRVRRMDAANDSWIAAEH